MTYTVDAEGLTKSYGDHLVLDHVDLRVRTGSVHALLGPNGAGKTTLVSILATLVRPDSGTARVAGHDLLTETFAVKHAISLTGQSAAVDDVLTGRENLEMMARLLHLPGRDVRRRTAELLREFDLGAAADRRAGTYSGGMRRRLDLAISLLGSPELIFLDEPTTGLDPRARQQLWTTVRGLVSTGITVLLTTQYLEEADALADRIEVLDRGRIVATGTPEELKSSLGRETLRLRYDDPAAFARALTQLTPDAHDDVLQILDVPTDGSADQVRDILNRLAALGVPADGVSVQRPSLDEVFLRLTEDDDATVERAS